MLPTIIQQLREGKPLSATQVCCAVTQLTDEQVPVELKADFLTALAQKGETPAEIAAFAMELRDKAIVPPLDAETRSREILDVVGTGGDRSNTFNISTTVAILCAAAGVTVAKHGNRAVTSQSGSADVLEALGIRIDLTPEEAAQALKKHGFVFLFAPRYHPAFKHVAPARKLCAERGQRTIFNFLGPLLNPIRPSAQLVGVPRPELCVPLARVLQQLGVRRAMVVCGTVAVEAATSLPGACSSQSNTGLHLDELSTLGPTTVAEFYQEHGFSVSSLSPEWFPVQPARLSDLAGQDRNANAGTVRRLLAGEERGPKRDAVLLNAAAALLVAGKARTLSDGWDLAAEVIESGAAARKLSALTATSQE